MDEQRGRTVSATPRPSCGGDRSIFCSKAATACHRFFPATTVAMYEPPSRSGVAAHGDSRCFEVSSGLARGRADLRNDDLARRDRADRRRFCLRESEIRHRALLEAVPQLVWTCGPDGGCDYFNPQWQGYTGAAGRPSRWGWLHVIHDLDREALKRRGEPRSRKAAYSTPRRDCVGRTGRIAGSRCARYRSQRPTGRSPDGLEQPPISRISSKPQRPSQEQ